jgi:hypothetical protein
MRCSSTAFGARDPGFFEALLCSAHAAADAQPVGQSEYPNFNHYAPFWGPAKIPIILYGSHVIINTVAGNLKLGNISQNPQVAVSVVDKNNPWRYAIVRGTVVEQTTEGADDHIEKLSQKYLGQKYPWRQPAQQRVILRIKPHHVMELGVS